jgi:hypothetical protein
VATASSPPRRRSPPAVAWILVLAVLVGVAAALLSRPVGSVAPGSSSIGGVTLQEFATICGVVLVAAVVLWVLLGYRNRAGRSPLPERLVAAILVTLLLGVVMVAALHLVHIAPIPNSGNSTSSSNNTQGTPGNNSSISLPNFFGHPGVTLPAWAGIAVLVGIAVLAAVLLVPYLVARSDFRKRQRDEVGGTARQAQDALRDTLHRLESAEGGDARAAILALYSRLLLLVGPRLGTVESLTPREIEHDSIAALGLRSSVARDLTETFEEARYSSHSMTPETVARARTALGGAIEDLGKSAGAPP